MSDPLVVDLFVEDRAHEEFLKPLLVRIAREETVEISVRVRSARGGHGRAIEELKLYQTLVERGAAGAALPDLLIVGIDGNCTSFTEKKKQIEKATRGQFVERLVAACPDPHVERWYLADPVSFEVVVGHRPSVRRRKCARDYYKDALGKAVRQAGHPATLGGIEFARDIVENLNWYRAGRNNTSLKAFLGDLRCGLRKLRGPEQGEHG